MALEGVFYDTITREEVYNAHVIETLGYAPDETDTLETFLYRHTHAGDFFIGAFISHAHCSRHRTLIGFLTGTCTDSPRFTQGAIYTHVPGGPFVCVQSLCVAPNYRRRYVGQGLLKHFLTRIECASYKKVLLIAHWDVIPFYEKVGFELTGFSDVIYGPRPWFELWKYPPFSLQEPGLSTGASDDNLLHVPFIFDSSPDLAGLDRNCEGSHWSGQEERQLHPTPRTRQEVILS